MIPSTNTDSPNWDGIGSCARRHDAGGVFDRCLRTDRYGRRAKHCRPPRCWTSALEASLANTCTESARPCKWASEFGRSSDRRCRARGAGPKPDLTSFALAFRPAPGVRARRAWR